MRLRAHLADTLYEIAADVPWGLAGVWEMPVSGPGLGHVSSQGQKVEGEATSH